MVARFGMGGELGQMVYDQSRKGFLGDNRMAPEARTYSEETAREIDLAVRAIVDAAYARAKDVLARRRAELDEGTRLLLEKETLTPEEFAPLRSARDASDDIGLSGATPAAPGSSGRVTATT